ncbi:MAG: hypothetical protein JNK40_06560 [Chromatiales bacterium]|nr:hypothetical protein [Chromatiales bacterium]
MQRRLIIVGDSHTVTFRPFDADVLAIFHPGAVTADAFTRPNNELTQQVLAFLSCLNPDGGTLVLSMGEVDIRAHYWRDIPLLVSRGMALEAFIEARVRALVQAVTAACNHFGFREAILWGPPASKLPGTAEHGAFPTTGDTVTRNILTHLFSRTCHAIASAGQPRFRFATLFYDMVDDDLATDAGWLADGVHVSGQLKPRCLAALAPVVAGDAPAFAGPRMASFNRQVFELTAAPLARPPGQSSALPHRAWISTAHEPQIRFSDSAPVGFSLAQALQDGTAGDDVAELVLRRRDGAGA